MAAESSSRPRARTLSWETVRSTLWRLIVSTVGTCMRNRVTGLAAEAAFFAVLSLPPLIFALAGSIGYIFAQFSDSQIGEVRNTVLDLAGQALTPQTVNSIIRPTLNEVLSGGGRYDVVSIGFILALWSGSRALNVFVDTITIMYGLGGHRGIVQHPRAVVPALRARHDHRRRHHPAGGRRPDADREVAARAVRLPQPALLADRPRARHLLPGHALPRVGAGADALALQPPGRGVHDVLLGVRLGAAAPRPRRYGEGLDLDLRTARRADRGAAVALPALHRGADRRRPQRRLRPALAAEGAHHGPPRAAQAAQARERAALALLAGARRVGAPEEDRSAEANDPARPTTRRPPEPATRQAAGRRDQPRYSGAAPARARRTLRSWRPFLDRSTRSSCRGSRSAACSPARSGSSSSSPTSGRSARRTAPACSAAIARDRSRVPEPGEWVVLRRWYDGPVTVEAALTRRPCAGLAPRRAAAPAPAR